MRRGLLPGTARIGSIAALALLVFAAAAAAAPTWLAPFEPLPASTRILIPAMNAGGEVLFADQTDLGGGRLAFRVADRPPGGSVGAPATFPPAGSTTLGFLPAVALADDGHAIVAWTDGGGAFFALRSPDGRWGAATPVPGATHVSNVVVGISATGSATLGWAENTNPSPGFMSLNNLDVQVARISPTGLVSSSQTLLTTTGTPNTAFVQTLQVTGSGRALLTYALSFMFLTSDTTAVFRDSAGGTFGDSTDLGSSTFPNGVRGAIGDGGRSAFVQASGTNIALRVRDPGGPLGSPTAVNGGGNVTNTLVGVAGDGAITLAWDLQSDADPRVMACTANTTECVGDPQRVSRAGGSLSLSSLAVNPAGAALLAWNTLQVSPTVVFGSRAALRPAAGAPFGAAQDVAAPPATNASVALDAAGDGVAVFTAGTGSGRPLMAAGLDAAGPRIDALSAPASVAQGAKASFAASASDVWSAVTGLDWSFGDGASASGGAVSHAFARSGSFPVTLTATDAAGNSTSRSATVTVRDTAAPAITRLTESARRFRVGGRATARSAAKAKRRARHRGGVPVGTTIRYALSEAGTASFRIERPQAGRRVGRACRKPTRANRRRHACTRYTAVGTLTRRAASGANALAFSGRIGRKALAPGSYRLTLTVTDAAGNRSAPRSLTFAIVRG